MTSIPRRCTRWLPWLGYFALIAIGVIAAIGCLNIETGGYYLLALYVACCFLLVLNRKGSYLRNLLALESELALLWAAFLVAWWIARGYEWADFGLTVFIRSWPSCSAIAVILLAAKHRIKWNFKIWLGAALVIFILFVRWPHFMTKGGPNYSLLDAFLRDMSQVWIVEAGVYVVFSAVLGWLVAVIVTTIVEVLHRIADAKTPAGNKEPGMRDT